MKQKIVVFVGEKSSGKTTAAKTFASGGFHQVSVKDLIRKSAKILAPKETSEEFLEELRERGARFSPNYWINQVLAIATQKYSKIVIDDAEPYELNDAMSVFQISKINPPPNKVEGANVIVNDGTLAEFETKIQDVLKTLS